MTYICFEVFPRNLQNDCLKRHPFGWRFSFKQKNVLIVHIKMYICQTV